MLGLRNHMLFTLCQIHAQYNSSLMIHESKVFIQETPLKVSSATSGHFLSPPCVNWTETRWTASWSVEAGASKYSHFRCLTLADDSCSQLPVSLWHLASDYAGTAPSPSTLCAFNLTQRDTGHFTGIGSAHWPDPTIGSGLTPDNKGTSFYASLWPIAVHETSRLEVTRNEVG